MFLFPWLDCGIDISVFGKIDFLTHEQFLSFLVPWKGAFLGPQVEFRLHSEAVEYSTSLKNFIFQKSNVSAFKCRVSRFFPTITEKNTTLKKKCEKKPYEPFDMRLSNSKMLIHVSVKLWEQSEIFRAYLLSVVFWFLEICNQLLKLGPKWLYSLN